METPWNNWFSDSEISDAGFLQQWEIASSNNSRQDSININQQIVGATGVGMACDGQNSPRSLHDIVGHSSDHYGSGTKAQETISWNFNLGNNNQMELDHGSCSSSGLMPLDLLPSNPTKHVAFARPKEEQKRELPIQRAGTTTTTLSQAQEHIIAERNRREKLNQKFIALSALIPGLKKADKASVLGDAVRYVKDLQEKVKALEEQNMETTVESVVFVKKSHVSVNDDEGSSSDENNNGDEPRPSQLQPFPEIEVKVSRKTVLIRIHCENRKGVLIKVLSEIESMNLIITNNNAMPFLGSSINITVTAQMDVEFSMTAKDIVRKLKSALV
ncbi:transcription factor bHLH18-like [Curcuma longa]|uniref:transcription factor bHLH18-like n=1 Tax=Curcuma longa TaxID=136217 RepID=UPI003D9F8FA5